MHTRTWTVRRLVFVALLVALLPSLLGCGVAAVRTDLSEVGIPRVVLCNTLREEEVGGVMLGLERLMNLVLDAFKDATEKELARQRALAQQDPDICARLQ